LTSAVSPCPHDLPVRNAATATIDRTYIAAGNHVFRDSEALPEFRNIKTALRKKQPEPITGVVELLILDVGGVALPPRLARAERRDGDDRQDGSVDTFSATLRPFRSSGISRPRFARSSRSPSRAR
jgi:hypothetical protein